ncbi:hypothetical protein T459_01515 [Capsicum annuum]|uniref:Carrier domain-containing protein n=1 Tax=Capsicum annuum TaxID=4072 RepID=A0A2G3AHI6_CAPAN|nr:Cell differentiation, Rcd1-like protein isoform 1 [Capsicum annuum]PHT93633.1 hypothetical protein T459_01515 [Capsicum annuum]
MEPREAIDELFLKLHPCFGTNTKIGIIGGGPSGISAAYALVKLGYTNITILEKYHSVGGMCESVDIEGNIYDLGGQVVAANSAPTIFHLAREIKADVEEMDNHKFALIDSTGKYNDIQVVQDYVSVIPLTLKLQDEAKASGRIGVHGVSEAAADLCPAFLEDNGLKSVPKAVAYGYTASGYGFVQDMPYAYLHEFIRTSMAGKIQRFKKGYTSIWKKLSERLPVTLLCNNEVVSLKRDSLGVHVDVKNEIDGELKTLEFDKIVVSGSFPFTGGKFYRSPASSNASVSKSRRIDMNSLEEELFDKVQTIDYYTTVLKITGFDHIPMGFYYFGEFMNDPKAIGNPVAMQRFYNDTNVFLFWSYGNSVDIVGSKVTELLIKVVESMGGLVEKVVLQRKFKYFPHVNSQDMKEGFYEKVENQLQGQQNTYYVGGLMAFELTERNASYAMALMRKHFTSNSAMPAFPYVKRLLPLKSDCILGSRQLNESSGITFPDLCSLNSYLRHWGTHPSTQDNTVYTWINEKGDVTDRRTYRTLHSNASTVAQKLLTCKKPTILPGDRVLLIYIPGLDFVDAFFGCLRAKVIPVPAIPPDPTQGGGQALLHIANIAKTCDAVAILSTSKYHFTVQTFSVKNMVFGRGNGRSSGGWPDLPWLYTDLWIKRSKIFKNSNEVAREDHDPLPNDLCFLQFTSGSTSDPKGVVITHIGIIHNVKLMRRRYRANTRTILVSWLPQYHDMGLIGGLFTCLVSGGSAILFSPMTFIKNPLLWLQTMSKYHATHSAGPNFAVELLVRRLESNKVQNLDLSSMTFLMVAAEPVRGTTLKRFIELTEPFGLSQEVMAPGYGLAENCVYVNSAYGEGLPILVDWQGKVCCGYANVHTADVEIKIVEPDTGREHDDSTKEGEIWISSLSTGAGYWGIEELSRKTFENELLTEPGKRYIRTGDLGRIIDGKLFITGRIKDLIIVAGRNIYSTDVEKTIEKASDLLRPGCCAVVGIPDEVLMSKGISFPKGSDQLGLVVVAEAYNPIPYEVIERIHTRVAEEHGICIASIVVIKPRSISKTTSGKIRRFEVAKRFIDGTLSILEDATDGEKSSQESKDVSTPQITRNLARGNDKISKGQIIEFLKELLYEMTGVPKFKISITESLVSYGVDSIGVVRAAQKISSFLGVPVGAIDIFSATCIEDLADYAEDLLIKSRPELVETTSNSCESKMGSTISTNIKVSDSHKLVIWFFQFLALAYVSFLLIFPACMSVSAFTFLVSKCQMLIQAAPWFGYILSLVCAPLSWILCILSTNICIAFLGKSFLQPNYMLNPEVSIWSIGFVKWWALYKAQEISSKVLAVHLRGTVFINYWFEMLGANIASSAILDTVDITDPSLVSIGGEAVINEGVLLQSHEVKNGVLSFNPIRIGQKSSIGPYAVAQRGRTVEDGAHVLALNTSTTAVKSVQAKSTQKDNSTRKITKGSQGNHEHISQLLSIYMVGFLSSLSAAVVYFIYLSLWQSSPSLKHFSFFCLAGAFHWFPYMIVTYATLFDNAPSFTFATTIAIAYISHGLILSFFTCLLNHVVRQKGEMDMTGTCLIHRVNVACHIRFTKFISGTELFCIYLRQLGAKIGQHCSIRAINPILEPSLISIGNGVHLGDFSRIVTGIYTLNNFVSGKIDIQDNSVIGSQGLVLPGCVIEKDVILGAISVAPMNSVLRHGGVFVGSKNPVMVKSKSYSLDDRIEEMDVKYKKVLGNLAANFAASTLKVRSRFFHRIGAAGKGYLSLYNDIPGFPDHKIFSPGTTYGVIMRHSNCLSSDDDARLDPRGAAIRILSNETDERRTILDLTLKTGKAFHTRTIGDFATWLVCGAAAREEHVKHAPHIRDAMWGSLRQTDSYTKLHYYSNICRLFRFKDDQEMYVKFKLRPFDNNIGEDSGEVKPRGVLPPETGAIPRDENDNRPLCFLDEDFQHRVHNSEKVRYVLQLQIRPIPEDEVTREVALDCTKPWDEIEFPYIEIGDITIDATLTKEESEELEFNPFLKCHEVDVIRATSCNQSASMDHGRSVVYDICQYLRNRKPLPEAWRFFLDQSDVKMDFTGCPLAATLEKKDTTKVVTLARSWYVTMWLISAQPFLQTFLPYFLMGLTIFAPLKCLFYMSDGLKVQKHWLLPLFWIVTGLLGGFLCAMAKWILVGIKKDGESELIWSKGIFSDTIWQAIRTLVGDYFMEMTSGSFLFGIWMKLMGSEVAWEEGAYIDSMGAVLNPEMVSVDKYGSIGREALLFGHIYEGEGGKVKYGKIKIGENGCVGSRAVAMPGVTIDNKGTLGDLSLAMKGELVK